MKKIMGLVLIAVISLSIAALLGLKLLIPKEEKPGNGKGV